VLRAGDDLGCWQLLDTDVVRPFPAPFKDPGRIQDRSGTPAGTLDAQAYTELLVMANYTSANAFARAARSDLTYAHLVANPARYRGEVVRIEGRLRRILRLKEELPPEARAQGVHDLYQAWIFPEGSGHNPFRVDFPELPPDFDRGLLGKEKVEPPLQVRCAGYFFKRFRYTSEAGKEKDAPLVIAHSLTLLPTPAGRAPVRVAAAPDTSSAMPLFMGLVALMVVAAVALGYWFRRGDRRVRARVHTSTKTGLGFFAEDAENSEQGPQAAPPAPPVIESGNGDGRHGGLPGP
jgi:hypothetical protein